MVLDLCFCPNTNCNQDLRVSCLEGISGFFFSFRKNIAFNILRDETYFNKHDQSEDDCNEYMRCASLFLESVCDEFVPESAVLRVLLQNLGSSNGIYSKNMNGSSTSSSPKETIGIEKKSNIQDGSSSHKGSNPTLDRINL